TEQVETPEEETTTEETDSTEEETDDTEEDTSDDQALEGSVLKFGYGAPHGTKSFAATFVGLEDDTITHAFIDEFQFMVGSVLKFGYGAPHGTKSFAATFVGLEDDTITHAFIDEFQFMGEGDWSGVPNSDGAFAEGYAEDSVLVSKVENDEAYSAMMEENAGATMTL